MTSIGQMESFGPMYLSSIAKLRGHKTRFVRFFKSDVLKNIEEFNPDIIAYSAFTGDFKPMSELDRHIKSTRNIFSIVGGPHITLFPKDIMTTEFDCAVIGEGEGAFADILDAFEKREEVDHIKNVVTKNSPDYTLRPLIDNLDEIPFPDFDGVYSDIPYFGAFPVKRFMPSRGCPYNCSYCFNHVYNQMYRGLGKIIRRYSVGRIINEINYVKSKYRAEFIRFNDDCFAVRNDAWMKEFTERYPKEVNIPFHCELNPNSASEELIASLKYAGCISVMMSIECGPEKYRIETLRRRHSNKTIIKAFKLCNQYGINVYSNSILGLPGTTFKDDLETLDLNIQCSPAYADASIFQPYPGIDLTNLAAKLGLYNPDSSKTQLPRTVFGRSGLDYDSTTKTKQKNLADLFCLLVEFPTLKKFVLPHIHRTNLMMPLIFANAILQGWKYKTKLYPHKTKLSDAKNNIINFYTYFKQIIIDR